MASYSGSYVNQEAVLTPEERMNLAALQRRDPYITTIIETASQVALYDYNTAEDAWASTDIEGSLFVYERVGTPHYGFTISNRKQPRNHWEALNSHVEFQAPEDDHFLLYKNKDDIFGIWFFDQGECEKIGTLVNQLIARSSESSSCLNEIGGKPEADQTGTGKHGIMKEILTSAAPTNAGGDIMAMLCKAQHEYSVFSSRVVQVGRPEASGQPPHAGDSAPPPQPPGPPHLLQRHLSAPAEHSKSISLSSLFANAKSQQDREQEERRLKELEERRLKELEERRLKELEERRMKELEERRLQEQEDQRLQEQEQRLKEQEEQWQKEQEQRQMEQLGAPSQQSHARVPDPGHWVESTHSPGAKMSDSQKHHEILSQRHRPTYRNILDELQGSEVGDSPTLPKCPSTLPEQPRIRKGTFSFFDGVQPLHCSKRVVEDHELLNGIGPSGTGPNGPGPNGPGPNGTSPNGPGPTGLVPTGTSLNNPGSDVLQSFVQKMRIDDKTSLQQKTKMKIQPLSIAGAYVSNQGLTHSSSPSPTSPLADQGFHCQADVDKGFHSLSNAVPLLTPDAFEPTSTHSGAKYPHPVTNGSKPDSSKFPSTDSNKFSSTLAPKKKRSSVSNQFFLLSDVDDDVLLEDSSDDLDSDDGLASLDLGAKLTDAPEGLTKEQLRQSLIHLLKTDDSFMNAIHAGYVQSLKVKTFNRK